MGLDERDVPALMDELAGAEAEVRDALGWMGVEPDAKPKPVVVCGGCAGARRRGNIVCWTCRGTGRVVA